MTSIVNLFSNFDDLTKSKSVTDNATNYNNNNEKLISLSLNQGGKFKKYQKKISNSLEKKANILSGIEGFQTNTNQTSNLTDQTNNLLKTTDISSQQQTIQDLQKQYNDTVNEYQTLISKINGSTTDYINRVSSNNPYLNKYIRWTDPAAGGSTMYVTNQGVAKPITSWDIYKGLWDKNGCPNDKSFVNITIPWDSSYVVEGTKIPTTPSLTVGTPMKANESCGNEGVNVYVDKLTKSSKANYKGCYGDNASARTMTFIGGSPPQTVSNIVNGDFSQPVKSNNSYEYITSVSKVPGWNFQNAVLVNNSSAWGYPTPYPKGNQCACIQNTAFMEQVINLSSGSYTLSFMACGRPSTGANPVDIQLNGKTVYSVTPSKSWTSYSTTITVTTSGNNTIKFLGKNSSGDKSSAFQGITTGGGTTSNGTYTYDMCKNEALDSGYKLFALQNVNTETSKGYCAVSNDSISATKNGTSYIITKVVALWDTKTNNNGSSASITDTGTLSVFNSSGTTIYNTPTDSKLTSGGYIGCYNDKSTRAMTNTSSGKYYSFATCKQYATDGNYKYYGSQNKDGNNNGWCVASNDLASSQKYGVANNCTKDKSGNYMGGPWSNAIYSMDSKGTYFLILQDDGNMVVYKGSSPSDNQGTIWSSKTNGKQKKANPAYAAAKGKYGKNWIVTGNTLAKGDFVGSTDGSIYLLMQTDGNLVLYTSETGENCLKMKDGNTGGGVDGNALYEFTETGIPANLGKIGYVDGNSILYSYPDSSIGLSNDYSSYTNYSSAGHDISGKAFSNATVDSCKSSCNSMKNCYGFDFDKTNKVCYPKDNTMYPKGSRKTNTSVDLYVRNPKITKPPIGITDKILNIDSLAYENYPKSNKEIKNSYNLTNATSVEKQQLDQLESTMTSLSSQLADLTTNFDTGSQSLEQQSQTNVKGIGNYLKDIKQTNTKIKGFDTSIDNILKDSDIVVLQKNYDYLFWSIVATATVLISINVVKNN
jgi:hypothetical protein